jgi:hypothetical protein
MEAALLGMILRLLNHDFELHSNPFTFGRIQTSLILLSLNHDFTSVVYVDAFLSRHGGEATTIEIVPNPIQTFPGEGFCTISLRGEASDARSLFVVDVENEGTGLLWQVASQFIEKASWHDAERLSCDSYCDLGIS